MGHITAPFYTRFRAKAYRVCEVVGFVRMPVAATLSRVFCAMSPSSMRMMSREEARTFGHITTHANHLSDRADMLREYSLQLYELHQTQIDLKQNSTMQILTIVTVIIANVLKCRPPSNRDPRPEEIQACTPFLREQTRTINHSPRASAGRGCRAQTAFYGISRRESRHFRMP